MTRTIALANAIALSLAACSPASDHHATEAEGNEQGQMHRSLDELTLSVRLKAAEGRIVQLERQVGALEATPEKIENQLLAQRLERLEARAYAAPSGSAPSSPPPSPIRKPEPTPTPIANRFNPFDL